MKVKPYLGILQQKSKNVKVSEFMLNQVQRGPGRGSMITGKQHALSAQDKQFLLCSLQGFIISKI